MLKLGELLDAERLRETTDGLSEAHAGAFGELAATFCIESTGSIIVDGTAGLPGPGAMLLPSVHEWMQ